MLVDTLVTLKNISEADRFNGLALIVQAEYAWYLFDSGSSASADDDLVVQPTTGTGRWIKLNNSSNIFNNYTSVIASTSTTTLDNANFDSIEVVFNTNTTINFETELRNGTTTCILNRNGGAWSITGWDSRVEWGDYSVYNFGVGDTITIIEFVVFDDTLYVVNINEF